MGKIKAAPTDNEPRRERVFILNETILRTSPTLACEIGLNESMVLLQLDFWISITNNFHDGRYWTYQSVRDMQRKAFPFWSIATINRAISKLIGNKYIIDGNYNKRKYDKTRWFALNFDRLSELKSIAIRKLETQSGSDAAQNDTRSNQNDTHSAQNETTIPEITTEITTENHPGPPVINTPGVEDEKKDDDNEQNKPKSLNNPDSNLLTGPVEINDDYYTDIEAKLSELNIRSQISSIEFKKIKEMKLAGISQKLILDTMDEVATNKARGKDGKNIKSFTYFVSAIWEKFNALPKPYDMDAAMKRQELLLQKAKEAGL